MFFTVPIAVVIVSVFPVSLPVSLFHGICFLVATLFSFLILAEVNFLLGLTAFFFKSIDGISRAKYVLIQLLSGLLLPLAFFPDWCRGFVEALPFKHISHTPLQFYLGKIPVSKALPIFLQEFIWWLVLLVLGQLLYSKAVRKLTLQGG